MKRLLFLIVIICACSLSSLHAKSNPILYVSLSQTKVQTGNVLYLSAYLEESKWKIQNQKWYLDGAELATNYGAPYKLEMQIGENIKPGEHTIKALAICRNGKKCINITEERRITVEKSQTIKSKNIFYLSTKNKDVSPGQALNIVAFSKSKDYNISYVNLYFDNQNIGTTEKLPFEYNINIGNTIRPGRHKVHGMAIGHCGTTVRTEYVVFYVDVKESNSYTSKTYKNKGLSKPLTITGHIYDEKGECMIGTTVAVVGVEGKHGTQTDFDGAFKLYVPANSKKLRVSYIGYKTAEIDLYDGMARDLKIYLKEE